MWKSEQIDNIILSVLDTQAKNQDLSQWSSLSLGTEASSHANWDEDDEAGNEHLTEGTTNKSGSVTVWGNRK